MIKEFRRANNLSQRYLADYLNVSQGFVSQIEKGQSKVPETILERLTNNSYNWDTSMLSSGTQSGGDHIEQNGGHHNVGKIVDTSSLMRELQDTKEALERERKRADEYWEMIKKLTDK